MLWGNKFLKVKMIKVEFVNERGRRRKTVKKRYGAVVLE